MKDTFFNEINVPSFLKEFFEEEKWYLSISKFKEIITNNIEDNSNSIKNDTIKTYNDVYIGKNCSIGDFIVIEGPVYIGDNVEIAHHVNIRPGSIIGDGCSVGHSSCVKNALMMDGSKIANHAFLGDSIIGSRARIGGHCETGNRRFDQKAIDFIFENEKFTTGLEKLGMILGEDSRMGGDVLTAPGTTVGKKTFVETGLTISGSIPSDSYVKNKHEYEIRENKFEGKLENNYKFMGGNQ